MDDKEKEDTVTDKIGVGLLLTILVLIVLTLGVNFYRSYLMSSSEPIVIIKQSQKAKCNSDFNSQDRLPENLSVGNIWSSSDDEAVTKDNFKALKYQLDQTNKQLNKTQKLIGCYFD